MLAVTQATHFTGREIKSREVERFSKVTQPATSRTGPALVLLLGWFSTMLFFVSRKSPLYPSSETGQDTKQIRVVLLNLKWDEPPSAPPALLLEASGY